MKEERKMSNTSEEQVVAIISPRSKGGVSMFETMTAITPDTARDFQSEKSDIDKTVSELERLGFNILSVGPISISFGGTQQLFDKVFGVELKKERKEIKPGHVVDFFTASKEDSARLLQLPQSLAGICEGVAIAQPPELFQSELPPITPVHPAAYHYLNVPDDVAVVLKASQAHRKGITGKDVVVAMIDTGHFAHPFFDAHGYNVLPTLLGPSASSPTIDMDGHGTGNSANIFAVAPDITLRPIKETTDPVGAFNVALSSSPKPEIIVCNWGYNIDYDTWDALLGSDPMLFMYLRTLEAMISYAVADGITVCSPCGNGTIHAFPGSHPDVISVGGVHVNYPSLTLRASDSASSFASALYPTRSHCPDVCGLTGRDIFGFAPSIMLPVQSGSSMDGIPPLTAPGLPGTTDGWGLFSGTSAASSHVAGVVALMLEKDSSLTPAQIKTALTTTAQDVLVGLSGTAEGAGFGVDSATGAGLVDADGAVGAV